MSTLSLFELLGMSNTDLVLVEAVARQGGDVSSLSAARIAQTGSDFVVIPKAGLELAFMTRTAFARDHAAPRGPGPYVLAAVFCYPHGSKTVAAYEGDAPFLTSGLRDREAALSAYGPPRNTEEDEDGIEWDEWLREGLRLRVRYKKDLRVSAIEVNVPFLK